MKDIDIEISGRKSMIFTNKCKQAPTNRSRYAGHIFAFIQLIWGLNLQASAFRQQKCSPCLKAIGTKSESEREHQNCGCGEIATRLWVLPTTMVICHSLKNRIIVPTSMSQHVPWYKATNLEFRVVSKVALPQDTWLLLFQFAPLSSGRLCVPFKTPYSCVLGKLRDQTHLLSPRH